jgi:hypothetical protein
MTTPETNPEGAGAAPPFNPDAPHHQRPKLRPIRGFPAKHQEQQLLALADAQQISDRVVFTAPAAQVVLPMLNGENDVDAIVTQVGRGLTRTWLEQFIAQLDGAGLIEGPTFDELLSEMHEQFDSRDVLPPGSTAAIAEFLVQQAHNGEATDEQKAAEAPDALRKQLDTWMNEALKDVEDPSLDALPKAIVAPHLDYARGWMNYAHVYGRMRVVDRPDRVIILGTNHFGFASGVSGCDKGFESPLGVCPMDEQFKESLCAALGDENSERLFQHRFDHEREHSIELHIPWIQHVFGDKDSQSQPKIFAALVHDPTRNNGESYDGQGVDILPFIEALKSAIEQAPGTTLIVSSVDLSHVGQQFGDQVQLANVEEEQSKAFREKVIQTDREMLQLVLDRKPEELVASMAWMQNPTRWCSIGALVATLKTAEPESVRLLHYAAAIDQNGSGMVSSSAMAMF